MLGNPGTQVGKKNLFVGIEYSNMLHTYDLDTKDIETSSERITMKVTTGLTDWMDIYIRGGGAALKLDYAQASGANRNFDSDFKAGFGGGTRIRLLNFVNSGTRVFFQGGGFFLKTDGDIQWNRLDGSILIKERDLKWADLYASLGISKRIDYIDLTFGVGFSEIWWEITDVEVTRSGTTESRIPRDKRDSFEIKNPIFGFLGLDFILPLEYRLSVQAGIRNIDDAEFSVSLSQGLEKE
ncbi:MAG: hypothetical protein JSV49_06140 [Thermoplasmata archaeon]|nr:MAG: hypothetical protein JSV49_06140 [Thermoplasmata archaeon]